MLSRSRALAAASLLTVLTLTGCGGSDSDPAPKDDKESSAAPVSDVDPATGKRISTDEYSYNAPEGWEEPGDVAGFEFDSAVLDPGDKDGFSDNVNVVRVDPAPTGNLDDFEDASVKELEAAKYTNVKVQSRQKVDGDSAIHLTSAANQNGVEYALNQYGVIHGDVVFVVTFSYSTDVSAEDQDDLAQSVLATWKWAS